MRAVVLAMALLLVTSSCGPSETAATAKPAPQNAQTATFAGGCFWCMEPPFEDLKGIHSVTAGYAYGEPAPSSKREAVEIVYDPNQITYEQLLEIFWSNIDPSDNKGQFCDRGDQYRSAIYYHDQEQKIRSNQSLVRIRKGATFKVLTDILPAQRFEPAPGYDQNYASTHPVRYAFYRYGCGRDQRLRKVWGAHSGHRR